MFAYYRSIKFMTASCEVDRHFSILHLRYRVRPASVRNGFDSLFSKPSTDAARAEPPRPTAADRPEVRDGRPSVIRREAGRQTPKCGSISGQRCRNARVSKYVSTPRTSYRHTGAKSLRSPSPSGEVATPTSSRKTRQYIQALSDRTANSWHGPLGGTPFRWPEPRRVPLGTTLARTHVRYLRHRSSKSRSDCFRLHLPLG